MNKTNLKYLVPNFFTALSLFLGLSALHLISLGNFFLAAWLIGSAMVCDFLDGKFARMLNAQSKFGAQFDTLSDFVTFGVAPGFLAYSSLLNEVNIVGAAVSIFYIFCGGYRLVRFTLKNKITSKKEPFIGLPIPAAAGMIASFIIFNSYFTNAKLIIDFLLISTFLVSILMISKIEYLPLEKGKKLSKESKFFIILAIISIVLAIKFSYFIFIIWMSIYILYGVLRQFLLTFKKQTRKFIKSEDTSI
ncbi:MAG: CDP-diacylglycerol--serine O-phosphatidyltransferase [Flavobacteriaceae bacterium]|nr:CDP-diacylglycerol--serine O-phosphatidyltransferase [Flavobacteriaceae bacterium]